MYAVWMGLKFYVPWSSGFKILFFNIYWLYIHIILKLVICIAILMLRRSLHWLCLSRHQVCFMVIKVWLQHSVSIVTFFKGQRKMKSVHSWTLSPNNNPRTKPVQWVRFPQLQFFNFPFILWWEVLTVIEVTFNRWCKNKLIRLFAG